MLSQMTPNNIKFWERDGDFEPNVIEQQQILPKIPFVHLVNGASVSENYNLIAIYHFMVAH